MGRRSASRMGGMAMVTWEYKRLGAGGGAILTEGELNAAGTDGWELVTVAVNNSGMYAFFKRRVAQ